MLSSPLVPWIVAMLVAGAALAAVELGYRAGRRSPPRETDRSHLGAVQGALLGLLGLLLGFSFAGATTRFIERQQLIVQEANAIGTAYLRADLLSVEHRQELRSALRAYTRERVTLSHELRPDAIREINRRCEASHEAMWRAGVAGVKEQPGVVMAVLPPINEVIDLHTTRAGAARRHLPALVVGLLAVCGALSLGMIGFGFGLTRRRNFGLTGTLALVIASAIWATIDMDYPRRGLIRINESALEELNFPDAADSAGP